MKFASFDAKGNITGFYMEKIHGPIGSPGCKIPSGVVAITAGQWLECINNPAKWMVDVKERSLVLAPPSPAPSRDVLLAGITRQRDKMLSGCDWTQLPDSPLPESGKAAWASYRQALRDFPAVCDPANPVWPEPPK